MCQAPCWPPGRHTTQLWSVLNVSSPCWWCGCYEAGTILSVQCADYYQRVQATERFLAALWYSLISLNLPVLPLCLMPENILVPMLCYGQYFLQKIVRSFNKNTLWIFTSSQISRFLLVPWTQAECFFFFFLTQTACWGQMLVEIWSLNTTGTEQELPKDISPKKWMRKEIFWEVSLQDETSFQNIKRVQKEKLKFQYLSWDVKNSTCSWFNPNMAGWPQCLADRNVAGRPKFCPSLEPNLNPI